MADRFQSLPETTTDLALAVKPVDALSGAGFGARVTVTVDGVPHDPVLNPSGYWLFLTPPVSLPADPVTVRVDAGPEYIPVASEETVAGLSPPAVRLDVFRSVAYPFAPGRTVVHGRVEDGGDPVFDATVTIEDAPPETRTDRAGRFALVIEPVVATTDDRLDSPLRVDPEDDTAPERVFVKPSGGPETEPHLRVTLPDGRTDSVEQPITEGELTRRTDAVAF